MAARHGSSKQPAVSHARPARRSMCIHTWQEASLCGSLLATLRSCLPLLGQLLAAPGRLGRNCHMGWAWPQHATVRAPSVRLVCTYFLRACFLLAIAHAAGLWAGGTWPTGLCTLHGLRSMAAEPLRALQMWLLLINTGLVPAEQLLLSMFPTGLMSPPPGASLHPPPPLHAAMPVHGLQAPAFPRTGAPTASCTSTSAEMTC